MRSAFVLATVASLALGVTTATADPADQARQRDFRAAAAEFGVPESVLLGVSYLESRWDINAGSPSTSAGFGPLHLTDLRAANPGKPVDAANLGTVTEAAALTGVSTEGLRTNAKQNIRGGAALLAKYQKDIGVVSDNPADWYAAVSKYSGASDTGAASTFANEVFVTVNQGAERVTDDGQHIRLPATRVQPNRKQLNRLGLRNSTPDNAECPRDLACEWIPAPYEEYNATYGNHDKANRPESQEIKYIVIHDTEGEWDGVLNLVKNPRNNASWQYTLRSADGHVAQHVKAKDVAWQAGNWYLNAKSIGLEHEGFAKLGTWYTEAMYRSSAKLVRYLSAKYRIPLDRAHIIGHDNIPGATPDRVGAMHWDAGSYWDWSHYFDLLGKPFRPTGAFGLVTIKPDFASNKPAFTGCAAPGELCAPHGSTSVILHTEPNESSALLKDPGLRPDGSPGTMAIADHSSRVDTGQQYAVAEVRGDWTAIWYLGQKGWFHNPNALGAAGLVATPKAGKATVPVYGRAYPEAAAYPANIAPQALVPLQYTFSAGERYTVGEIVPSEYYAATTFDPANHTVVRGKTKYVQIQFGHRFMYVNADDVDILG